MWLAILTIIMAILAVIALIFNAVSIGHTLPYIKYIAVGVTILIVFIISVLVNTIVQPTVVYQLLKTKFNIKEFLNAQSLRQMLSIIKRHYIDLFVLLLTDIITVTIATGINALLFISSSLVGGITYVGTVYTKIFIKSEFFKLLDEENIN
jgi:hypothetical protein